MRKCCGDHVAAGFMPAFKLQPEIVLVIKRGHKARGYVPVYNLRLILSLNLSLRDYVTVKARVILPEV